MKYYSAIGEEYLEHIRNMLNHWEHLKHRYLPSITMRIAKMFPHLEITMNDVGDIVKLMAIFHDAGKLTDVYQKGYIGGDERYKVFHVRYPHEFWGFALAYNVLYNVFKERILPVYPALGILYHHEFFTVKTIARIHRFRSVVLTKLYDQYGVYYRRFREKAALSIEALSYLDNIVEKIVGEKYLIRKNIGPKIAYDIVKRTIIKVLSLFSGALWGEKAHVYRLLFSIFHHILILLDYRGACSRVGSKPKFAEVISRARLPILHSRT